jgi:hypothetical protein
MKYPVFILLCLIGLSLGTACGSKNTAGTQTESLETTDSLTSPTSTTPTKSDNPLEGIWYNTDTTAMMGQVLEFKPDNTIDLSPMGVYRYKLENGKITYTPVDDAGVYFEESILVLSQDSLVIGDETQRLNSYVRKR